jgi:hypothetical protein
MAIDKQFIVNLSGKDHVVYAGLLSEAHERGLLAIETQVLQLPTEENGHTAVARAVVRMKDGSYFEEHGDANPRNVGARIATALIRMALTRAKGRALRDAVNVGVAMFEELPDLEEATAANGHRTPHAAARARETAAGSAAGVPAKTGFEATYGEAGTRHYTREELIAGTRKRMEQAKALGCAVPVRDLEKTPNKELFALAEMLAAEIKAAKVEAEMAAQADALAAEVS